MINKQTEEPHAGSPINRVEDKLPPPDGTGYAQGADFPSFRNQLPFSTDHPASDVVTTTLQTLLNNVWKACAAASEPAAHPETVRCLRVTSRRTLVALSVFSPLLPKAVVSSFKQQLRDLRRAAGATRDYDVLSERLHQHIPPTSDIHIVHDLFIDEILRLVVNQQSKNRKSIHAIYSELLSWNWPLRVAAIKKQVQPKKNAYLKFVRNEIKKTRTKFAKVANSAKKDPAQVHRLRIAGKKLRYALELMPDEHMNSSLQKCKATLQRIQKKLGNFTDHTAASEILKQFSKEPLADDMLFVIHKMQQEEHELATLSCRQFFGWWTGKRRRSMYKRLEKGLDND